MKRIMIVILSAALAIGGAAAFGDSIALSVEQNAFLGVYNPYQNVGSAGGGADIFLDWELLPFLSLGLNLGYTYYPGASGYTGYYWNMPTLGLNAKFRYSLAPSLDLFARAGLNYSYYGLNQYSDTYHGECLIAFVGAGVSWWFIPSMSIDAE